MPKIKTGNITKGRPGFKTKGATITQFTGKRVNQNRTGASGVRRLFAQNPADGKTANIGTRKDYNSLAQGNRIVNHLTKIRSISGRDKARVSVGSKVVARVNRSVRVTRK
jgi:hypothetical protein